MLRPAIPRPPAPYEFPGVGTPRLREWSCGAGFAVKDPYTSSTMTQDLRNAVLGKLAEYLKGVLTNGLLDGDAEG